MNDEEKNMMVKNRKYAVVDSKYNIICLRNEHHPLWDIVFEKYIISKSNTVIEGDVLDYVFEMHSNSLSPDLIDASQFVDKKFLWWTWKSCRSSWILLKKRKHMKITNPKGFIIVEEA
jgi:hypothetical protein